MNNLDKVLMEIEEHEELDIQNVFAVEDLETAVEAQRRIAWFEERMKEIDRIIEKQVEPFIEKINKIHAWGEEAKEEHEQKKAHYANMLEQYFRDEVKKQIEAGKKPKKTLNMPYGKISLKKQQPEFLKDEATLLEYAKGVGFVKVKETTDWSTLKKNCVVSNGKLFDKASGEEIPGVSVVERDEKFSIELNEGN